MPNTGETKTFPNGNTGRWDGTGWELVSEAQSAGAPTPKRSLNDSITDMGVGAVKGLAEHTSNAVGLVPGVTSATNAIGNAIGGYAGRKLYGTEAQSVTPQQAKDSLKATNTAQKVGKGAESVAEFMVPAQAARLATIEKFVQAIPANASPALMKTLNNIAAIAGRTLGEAGSAGAVGIAQGNEHPERAALMAGAGPLVGEAAKSGAGLLKYPLTQKMVAILAGAGGAQALGGITPGGLGAGFGAYALTRSVATKILSKPNVVSKLQRAAVSGSRDAARLLAAVYGASTDDEGQD